MTLSTARRLPLSVRAWIGAAALAAVALAASGCAAGATSPDGPTQYTLTIRNNTNTAFDIYMNTPSDLIGFRPFGGQSPAHSDVLIPQLISSQSYTFRLSPVGAGASAYLYERVFTSNSSDVTWDVQ